MKKITLTIIILVTSLAIHAQDKYEFMIIEYSNSLRNEIHISINGKEYLQEKADFFKQEKSNQNVNPLINKMLEYQDKGWEFISFGNGVPISQGSYIAYMKKKKIEK